MRRIGAVSVALALCACGSKSTKKDGIADGVQSPNNVTLVAPSTPRGTLSGQILDVELTPLAGANIAVSVGEPAADVGGSWQTTTDSGGNFTIAFLPAGAVVGITASAAGHATVRTRAFIPASAGTFPIDNGNAVVGPLLLTALNQGLKVLVIDHNGVPVQKTKVIVEASPAGTDLSGGGAYGSPLGTIVATTSTDTGGNATFTGLPASDELSRLQGFYTVTVPAVLDMSGNPTSGGRVVTYTGQSIALDPSVRVIQLPDARAGAFQLVASNAQSMLGTTAPLGNLLAPMDPVYLVFSHAVQPTSFIVTMTDEYGTTKVGTNVTWSQNGNMATVTPMTSLVPGQEYNLAVRADSLDDGSSLYIKGYFFAGDPAAPQPFGMSTTAPGGLTAVQYVDGTGVLANGILDPGEQVIIYFNQAVGWTGTQSLLFAQFNKDLDNSGQVGDATGELGYKGDTVGEPDLGFRVGLDEPANEPGTAFPLVPSNYSTRWNFFYFPPPLKAVGSQQVQPSTTMVLLFTKLANTSGGIQNVWGTQITSDPAPTPISHAP